MSESVIDLLTPPAATYRARLRFRVLKKLNIDAPEYRLTVTGREVVPAARLPTLLFETPSG